MVALFVVTTIIVFLVIDYFVQRAEKRKAALAPAAQVSAKARFVIPKGYFFGKGHTWVELLSNGSTRIGLDDFVQKNLGPIDQVSVVPVNNEVVKGGKLFTIKQGNKEMSFRAPISGRIVAFNNELTHLPDMIKKEPYKNGWVAMIEPSDLAGEIKQLSIGNEAAQWLKEEIKRFRNFITVQTAAIASSGSPSLVPQMRDPLRVLHEFINSKSCKPTVDESLTFGTGVTLMDGGIPVNDVLEHSSQEVWQMFENDFLASENAKARTNS